MDEREELAALRRLAELEAKASGKPVSVGAGEAINSIPRQIGLTARYGIEGLANTAQILTEPIRNALNNLGGAVPMRGEGGESPLMMGRNAPSMRPLGAATTSILDAAGFPSPQTADERVVGDATRLVAGAGGLGGAASAAQALPGMAGKAASFLSANMPQQLISAGGAGLAGGASREAGGSPLMQAGAALAGGVGSALGAQAVAGAANKVGTVARNLMPGQQQVIQQRVDQTINVTLQQSGIDPATITPAMRAALREQVQRAMNTGGDLNPQALSRLADYTRLGMTPTRARLTLDPFDVTQEQNASRLAAATGARDARLPQIAQENNARLLSTIDDMGGARPVDTYGQGSAVTRAVQSTDERMERDVRAAYQAFRESTGRELPVPLGPIKQGYQETLKDFGETIPSGVRRQFDEILSGPKAPHSHGQKAPAPPPLLILDERGGVLSDLTPKPTPKTLSIEDAERLIKTINRNYNPADLAQARALNDLRGHVQRSIIGATESGEGMEAATLGNFARDAARQRFTWQESSPAITRALSGANADTFVAQNIVSKAAGYDNVASLAQVVNQNPAARDAVRTAIVQQLKDSAIGKGGTTETGNVSGRGLTAALKDIGDRKLGLFFAPEEIETLKAMGRTGSFEVFQPRGSAVNNSNTAAGIGGLLQGLSKYVKPVANKLPFGEVAVSKPLDNLTVSVLQRQAQDLTGGLLMPRQRPPFAQGLLLPGFAAGGLLSAPP